MTANRFRQRKAGRPLYLLVERLVRPSTGEEVGAFVPAYQCDRLEMRARKYNRGLLLRGLLTKPRNEKFHRKAHALGTLAKTHIPGFEDLNAHDALKALQRESGVQCDEMDFDFPGLGKVVLKFPRSIAFDEMDEADFEELWNGILGHVRAKYWPTLSEYAIEEFALMQEGET